MKYAVIFCAGFISFNAISAPLPLPNLGNSCYMNAIVQNLLNIEPLNTFLLASTNISGSLIPAYIELIKDKNLRKIEDNNLENFYKQINALVSQNGALHLQEDASEFYTKFVDTLLEDMKSSKANLQKILSEKVVTVFSSKMGNDRIQKTTFANTQNVPVVGCDSIKACLDNYFKPQNIGDASINGILRDDVQELVRLEALPEVLVLVLNRYDNYGNKISDERALPHDITLYPYATDELKKNISDKKEFDYVLVGIVLHHGSGVSSGHYTTYIQDVVQDGWYVCDDSTITSLGQDFVSQTGYDETRNAYLLFYMRQSTLNIVRTEYRVNQQVQRAQDQLAAAFTDLA